MSQCKGSPAGNVVALRPLAGSSIHTAYENFMLDRRIAGATDATMAVYRYQLLPFVRWCAPQGIDLHELTSSHIRSFLALRQQRSHNALCESTLRLRTFIGWCASQGMCADVMASIRPPRRQAKVLPALSVAQMKAMLAYCRGDGFIARRNDAFIRFLVDTGLRASEALSLSLDDVEMERFCAVVNGKGNKERFVFFGPRTARALARYLHARERLRGTASTFFVNQFGLALNRRHAHQIVARLGRRAGVTGVRVSPHTLRHTFATLFLQRDGDALTLQRLLGHSTLAMTQRYVSLRTDDLLAAHRRAGVGDLL